MPVRRSAAKRLLSVPALLCVATMASCAHTTPSSRPGTSFAYVLTDGQGGTLSKVNLNTRRILWTVESGTSGSVMVANSDQLGICVGNDPDSGSIAFVNKNGSMGPRLSVPGSVQGLAYVSSHPQLIYVLWTEQSGASFVEAVAWPSGSVSWQKAVGFGAFALVGSSVNDQLALLTRASPSNGMGPGESDWLVILAAGTGMTSADTSLATPAAGLLFRRDGTLVVGEDRRLATWSPSTNRISQLANVGEDVAAATMHPIVEAPGAMLLVSGAGGLSQVSPSGKTAYGGTWPGRAPPHSIAETNTGTLLALMPRATLVEYRSSTFVSQRLADFSGIGEDVVAAPW